MNKEILIITSSIDCTVDYIISKCTHETFFRLDVDRLDNFDFFVGSSEHTWQIKDKNKNKTISLEKIIAIYYRKPMFPNISEYEPVYHEMIQKDIYALISGIADSFSGTVLSKPTKLREAENKVNQLIYAINHKWQIPTSFIGTSNKKQQEFLSTKSIIKPLTTGKIYKESVCELYQTNLFTHADNNISLTPIYLQEYIPKAYEARITVINKTFYTVKITTEDKIDWRKDYQNHSYEIIECPKSIQRKCLQMLSYYGLSFGAFDFIITPQNKWIFLELNPNGQWLWLEKALHLDISKKIIEFLKGQHNEKDV